MFDINQVTCVYSGRKGCACGCMGKYSYASKFRDARPSYYAHDDDDGISDRSVKTIVNKVEQLLADPDSGVNQIMIDEGGEWFAVDMYWNRTYTIFFQEQKVADKTYVDQLEALLQ